jgi:hypothetical protein
MNYWMQEWCNTPEGLELITPLFQPHTAEVCSYGISDSYSNGFKNIVA